MPSPQLSRQRTLFERHWPWLLLTAAATLFAAVSCALLELGLFEEYALFPRIVRGYTLAGVLFGVGSLALATLAFFYAFRKRGLQERLPLGRSTMTAWLWAHVYFGLLALVAAIVHAGYGLISFEISAGKVAFYALLVLVVSGVIWRIVYATVPARAAREVGNYSAGATRARADALHVEMEKLAAGVSPRFRELRAWARAQRPGDAELAQACASLPEAEQQRFMELSGLTLSSARLVERARKQARYTRLLQGLRVLHVPVSLVFLLAVPVHLLFAYDLPARAVPLGAVPGSDLGGFESAERCVDCHREIVQAWRQSMHAHAMKSPLMIAQNNQVAVEVLANAPSPDPKLICVNCHGPIGVALTGQARLPLVAPLTIAGDDAFLNEGITCGVCHQWDGTPQIAGAGLTRFQAGLRPGHQYRGPIVDPVGNAFHQSVLSGHFREPEALCQNCHSVQFDKNGDGKIQRGVDLVLQSLYDEWADFRAIGGRAGCVDCHMPVVANARVAENAVIPFEQDRAAPPRQVHDHAFVGTDYPLDEPAIQNASRPARQALLRGAASLLVLPQSLKSDRASLRFSVEVKNIGTGHNIPGGFAFVRQMWLEVSVFDGAGQLLAGSGRLANPTDDLCDASILSDPQNPMREFLRGCARADPLLANFQQMLIDVTQIRRDAAGQPLLDQRGDFVLERAPTGKESVIQTLTAGPTPRIRPFDRKPTLTLRPGTARAFDYAFDLVPGTRPQSVKIRLLFRTNPPYFVRALARGEPAPNRTRLEALISNIEVVEMANTSLTLGGN